MWIFFGFDLFMGGRGWGCVDVIFIVWVSWNSWCYGWCVCVNIWVVVLCWGLMMWGVMGNDCWIYFVECGIFMWVIYSGNEWCLLFYVGW